MNTISMIGRAVAIPELKSTNSGIHFCSFTLAVDDGTQSAPHTSFIPCIAWRKTADFASQYIKKGQKYGVVGTLKQGEYTDKNGQKRRTYDVHVNDITFCESRRNEEPSEEEYPDTDTTDAPIVPNDEDLPF